MEQIYWIGMDYHMEKTMITVLQGYEDRIVGQHTVSSRPSKILEVLLRYHKNGEVRCCYEASSCGFGLIRFLRSRGLCCEMVAPHSLCRSVATRVKKTDRLDAVQLARQFRSGELKKVAIPSEPQEQVRRYIRFLQEQKAMVRLCKTRITFLCIQTGQHYTGDSWTKRHRRWLETLSLSPLDQEILSQRLNLLGDLEERVDTMEERASELVEENGGLAVVQRLMTLRGVSFGAAAILWSELWDGERFAHPRQLMSYLGLDCKEHSSGNQQHRGSITKQGNARLRRVMVDAACAYRKSPSVSPHGSWAKRCVGQPQEVVGYAIRAQERLCKRYWHLSQSTGSTAKAKVAVARELCGFVWGMMQREVPKEQQKTA